MFGVKPTGDTVVLPGMMSRKKEIIPALYTCLNGESNLATWFIEAVKPEACFSKTFIFFNVVQKKLI